LTGDSFPRENEIVAPIKIGAIIVQYIIVKIQINTKSTTKFSYIQELSAMLRKTLSQMKYIGGTVEKELFYSKNKKVDKKTIFQVSSLSKFVSAVGVTKLVEMGKINLDTPVSCYFK